MQDRRTFLGIAAAALLPIGIDAQAPGPRPPAELARHALTGPLEGFEAVLALVSLLAFSIPVRAATRLDAVAAIRHE